jgi:hypothetical protein
MVSSMMRGIRFLCAAAMLLGQPVVTTRADEAVDLELVLAVDVSGSMDRDEQELQRGGYASALVHPEVLAAIRTGINARIAVTYVEWAGSTAQRVVVPWTAIESLETAESVSAAIRRAPLGSMRGTSISGGLGFSAGLFESNGFDGIRRVIDISGDGPNNMGPTVTPVRDKIVADGIIINGLPIMLRPSNGFAGLINLDLYYEDCVIGGPGAFIIPVDAPDQLAPAIRRKLVLEIAWRAPHFILAAQPRSPRVDCLIGEAARRP